MAPSARGTLSIQSHDAQWAGALLAPRSGTENLQVVTGRRTTSAGPPWLVALWACVLPGCAAIQAGAWRDPLTVAPTTVFDLIDGSEASLAEDWLDEAVRLDREGSAAAVDAYLQCAVAAWPAVEMIAGRLAVDSAFASPAIDVSVQDSREWELYRSAVVGLIESAQKFGRWSPTTGLLAMGPHGLQPVETAYHGFLWSPAEFGALRSADDSTALRPARSHRREGVGVPLIVIRNDAGAQRPFVQPGRQFAATALVRPVHTAAGTSVRLEFYDPLRESQARLAVGAVPLASDISAPLGREGIDVTQAWLQPFLRPAGEGADDNLVMLEPYQPGKIPVLFIHGLLSDPLTWTDVVNDLQAQPQLISRYQIWTFGYDTGEPFLTSAVSLRQQLAELRAFYNPYRNDPQASNMIIVGHSMGGLVAKLQVVYSGDSLWNAAARIPLEQVNTDAATRERLGDAFFFDPSNDVTRVVYIGTPHLGSVWARRLVGSLGSALVEPSAVAAERHDQLMRDNPGMFSEEMTRRMPTSIDLLEPSSPLLNATARLPYRHGVELHSIIGEGRYTVGSGPSDGVVPVSSARLGGVVSEKFVDSRHGQEPRNEDVIAEVMRILVEHARTADACVPNG